jgi:hypothetical protein
MHLLACAGAHSNVHAYKMKCFINNTKSISFTICYSLLKARILGRPQSQAHTMITGLGVKLTTTGGGIGQKFSMKVGHGEKGSISPKIYALLFRTKVLCEPFLYLYFKLKLFLAQEYWRKCALKMLVKLTTGKEKNYAEEKKDGMVT